MKFIIKMYCDSDEELSNEDIKNMVNENMLQYIDCVSYSAHYGGVYTPFVVEKIDVVEMIALKNNDPKDDPGPQ
jgi:hypothetical protein